MKHLKKILVLVVLLLSTTAYAQVKIIPETRKLLVPKVDSLQKFMQLNKIDYALTTYSTTNWISLDNIFYAIVKKKQTYYLMRWANLDLYAKKPILKINQKKLNRIEAQTYLKLIAPTDAFKHSNEDYRKFSQPCTIIHGTDTIVEKIYDDYTLYIYEFNKNYKKSINTYAPSFYLQNCYGSFPEYGILKDFVNTYDKLTELVQKAFKDDVILPIQNRPRTE
ncbi:MAG: hypothetical protein ACKOWL_03830 [Sphingobacteriaceae bacterium]